MSLWMKTTTMILPNAMFAFRYWLWMHRRRTVSLRRDFRYDGDNAVRVLTYYRKGPDCAVDRDDYSPLNRVDHRSRWSTSISVSHRIRNDWPVRKKQRSNIVRRSDSIRSGTSPLTACVGVRTVFDFFTMVLQFCNIHSRVATELDYDWNTYLIEGWLFLCTKIESSGWLLVQRSQFIPAIDDVSRRRGRLIFFR